MAGKITQLVPASAVGANDFMEIAQDVGSSFQSRRISAIELAGLVSPGTFTQGDTNAVTRFSQNKMRDTLSVKDYGAVGENSGYDHEAIQSAIDAMAARGGGIVFIPAGNYGLGQPITVKAGVWLVGDGSRAGPRWHATNGSWLLSSEGTTLSIVHGSGTSSEANAGFIMENGSGIIGCSFFYAFQSGNTATPDVYPPTIVLGTESTAGALADIVIANCTFINPYFGVKLSKLHSRFTMFDCRMSPWFKGIEVDKSLDVDRFLDVHIHPGFMYVDGTFPAYNSYDFAFQNANAIGLNIGGADQAYFTRVFVYGTRTALRLGIINGNVPNGISFLQCGFEGCYDAVVATGAMNHVSFKNCILASVDLIPVDGYRGNNVFTITGGSSVLTVDDMVIEGCYIFNSRRFAINANNFSNLRIINNTWREVHQANVGGVEAAFDFGNVSGGGTLIFSMNRVQLPSAGIANLRYMNLGGVRGLVMRDNHFSHQVDATAMMAFVNCANGRVRDNFEYGSGGAIFESGSTDMIIDPLIAYTA